MQAVEEAPHPDQISARLDDLYDAISNVKIVGETTKQVTSTQQSQSKKGVAAALDITTIGPNARLEAALEDSVAIQTGEIFGQSGYEKFDIEFSSVYSALSGLIKVLGNPKIWLLVDEWSEVPLDFQPYLADLFRRAILPNKQIIFKVASIEHRSQFSFPRENGGYIGIELGADMSADLNLDDFLVFDNDQAKAVDFFEKLIFKHYVAVRGSNTESNSPDDLVSIVFTQQPVFDEFVRAVEGVPRDALNLVH